MTNSIFGLMNEVYPVLVEKFPWVAALRWDVTDNSATTNVEQLWREYSKRTEKGTEWTFVAPPEFLSVIDYLYTEHGWKRGGWHVRMWEAYVYRREGDLEVRILGIVKNRPDGRDDEMNSLFAPERPPIRRGKKWIEEIKEYERKCREDEW